MLRSGPFLPRRWDVEGDNLILSIHHGLMAAKFTGNLSGGWRPSPGADETVNAPYDIHVSRVR
jgi:hypothetical protein